MADRQLASKGHISTHNFTFGDEIMEIGGKLNFYVQAEFDVDAVFGTHVLTDENMEQLVTLTVEARQTDCGKPKDKSYLEKDLPASLDKALREYIQGEQDKVTYMDCLWGELYGAINSNQWSNSITQEQADYLKEKYL